MGSDNWHLQKGRNKMRDESKDGRIFPQRRLCTAEKCLKSKYSKMTHLSSVELVGVGRPVRLCQRGVCQKAVNTWNSRGRQGSPGGRSSPGTGRSSPPPPPPPPPSSRSLPAPPTQRWKHCWCHLPCRHRLNLHCLNPRSKEPKERSLGCKAHNYVGLALMDQECWSVTLMCYFVTLE